MKLAIVAIGIVAVGVPALALAVPPREKTNRPQQRPGGPQRVGGQQRPTMNPVGPSLSTAGRPGGGQASRPGGGRPDPGAGNLGSGGGHPGGGNGGANRPGGPSFVASRPADRPSQAGNRPSGSWRPGGDDRPGNRLRPGDVTRPGNRPDLNRPGGNRPNVDVNRPNVDVNRPNVDVNRPNVNINRPNVNVNRPNVNVNRPQIAINRPNVNVNRPNINVDRPVVVNRPVTNIDNTVVNNTVVNNNKVVNQQFNRNNDSWRGRNYYSHLHHHWQPTTWGGAYQPVYSNYYANSGGYASSWMGSGVSRYAYVNPFYAAQPSTNLSVQVVDYSQPIRVPAPDYQETNDDLVRSEQAIRRFDDARELFRRGEYGRANDAIDEAVKILPNDPTLHQLRGLILFARQRYQEAAAAVYSVLAVSTGWDWETVGSLYEEPKRYEEQLRDLEKYVTSKPEVSEAQFLLAYHAAILGDLPMAEAQLEQVRAAKPDDRLTEAMLVGLRQQAEGE